MPSFNLNRNRFKILPENYPYKIETKPLVLVNPLEKSTETEFLF